MTEAFSGLFLAEVHEAFRDSADPTAIEDLLQEIVASLEPAPPSAKAAGDFVTYLAQRVPAAITDIDGLRGIFANDLYLAMLCTRGDKAALGRLETDHLTPAIRALGRMNLSEEQASETRQLLRVELLVNDGNRPGRIATYGGQSDLVSWLRVCAVRAALKLIRKSSRELPSEDEYLLRVPASMPDPETQQIHDRYSSEFKTALAAAFARLSAREQNLLRHHYIDELSLEEVAALYGVHRATAARWLARAREAVVDFVAKRLRDERRVPASECESLVRFAQGHPHLTLSSILRPPR